MAAHSSTLAWEILWTEEPGGLLSMELQRVGHDWAQTDIYMKDSEDLRIHRQDMQFFLSNPHACMPPCPCICCAFSLVCLAPSSLCRAHSWNQACGTVPGPSLSSGKVSVPVSSMLGSQAQTAWGPSGNICEWGSWVSVGEQGSLHLSFQGPL